jgi:serine/threonine-protein kinase
MPTGNVSSSAAAAAPRLARRISSDSIPVGGFAPGVILSDRYRIIGLLGRGGMGEVYRADDLKLGQPVALKFLPRALASDPVRRERFFAEVRITRQLAHPNICRVYDIAEFEGQHFLSMEYIDGEDLASLIKRIGYLSNEKALEITRQLIAGVAAAHDRGVLHRDLKPANIMLDGHGRVRITDFGLAMVADDETQAAEVFGTPAYMAPEQFAGKGASVRSDIYALGLVLYEIYTGKRAFTGTTLAEIRQEKERATPTAPSEIRAAIDPIVERLIMRSLERDPRSRPASAAQLAAALPGGDPLAAAIAAGETPSPEMVAASGLKEGLRPAIALALAAVFIIGAIATFIGNGRTMLAQRVQMDKPRDVLIERARELIKKTGYTAKAADYTFDFSVNGDMLRYLEGVNGNGSPRKMLGNVNPVRFWYRESPLPLEHWVVQTFNTTLSYSDPPMQLSGDALVSLDSEGRLRSFRIVPSQEEDSTGPPAAPDWTLFFSEAGFDPSKLTPVEPRRVPLYYADTRAAWQGSLPETPEVPLRIEAAAYRGKPVDFEIIGPWTRAERMVPRAATLGQNVSSAVLTIMLAALVIGGLYFARQNLRLGRGDRRGATRVALFVFCSGMITWILTEQHVPTFWEVYLAFAGLAVNLLLAALTWVVYIALEPYVRRRRPQVLVSWTRVLSGELTDTLVGRDVLIGCAFGAVFSILDQIQVLAPGWFGKPTELSVLSLRLLAHPAQALQSANGEVALFIGMWILFLLFLLQTLLRRDWLAASVLTLALSIFALQSSTPWVEAPVLILYQGLGVFLLLRFGLLALIISAYVDNIFDAFPMTLQTSAWYSGLGFVGLFIVLAITAYGFRISLGSRPMIAVSAED